MARQIDHITDEFRSPYRVQRQTRLKRIFHYLILIASVSYIYKTLAIDNDIRTLFEQVELEWNLVSILPLSIALVLVVPNWSLEALKWKIAIEPIIITFYRCMRSILTGVTLGLFTPARLGEYVGRMMLIGKEKRGASVVATFICSLAQSVITMSFGILALLHYVDTDLFQTSGLHRQLVLLSGVGIMVFGLFLYFKIHLVTDYLSKYSWLSTYGIPLGIKQPLGQQLRLLSLALVRYVVYLLQYLLVLKFCGISLSFSVLAVHIALIFFIQSLIPLPPIANLFARTSVATAVFWHLGVNELVIVLASLMIWVINLLIPALCGLGIIMFKKE